MSGKKPGRESETERIYFNAVGLAYIDVAIAMAMFKRASEQQKGTKLDLQQSMVFEHPDLKTKIQR